MKHRLFVFGCSYATGEELMLHQLGDIDNYRISTSKDPRKFFKKLEEENLQDKYEKIKQDQKRIAWPQLLADKLNYDCINLAESGNSLDKMVFQFFKEQENISNDDLVIMSLTKASRNAYFNSSVESFQLPSLLWPVKSLLGVKDTGDVKPVISKETDQALLEWFTDDRIVWDFIKNLKILENTQANIVPAMSDEFKTTIPILEIMINKSKEKFITNKGLDDFCVERHAWGHPTLDAHIKYADHLYEILR